MKKLLLLLLNLVLGFSISAQDFYFTDLQSSFSRINPAATAIDYQSQLEVHYRKNGQSIWHTPNYSLFNLKYEQRFSIFNKSHLAFGVNTLLSNSEMTKEGIKEFRGALAYHFLNDEPSGNWKINLSVGSHFGFGRHIFLNKEISNALSESFNTTSGSYSVGDLANWFNTGAGLNLRFVQRKRNYLEFGLAVDHLNQPFSTKDKTNRLLYARHMSLAFNLAVARYWDVNLFYLNTKQADWQNRYYRLALRYQISDNQPYFLEYGIITRYYSGDSFHPWFLWGLDLWGITAGITLKNIRCQLTLEPVGSQINDTNFEISTSFIIQTASKTVKLKTAK